MSKRKIAALIITAAGLILSLILIVSSNHRGGNTLVTVSATNEKSGTNPFLKFKNSVSLSSAAGSDGTIGPSSLGGNLTDNLIGAYAREFVKNNLNGPQKIGDKTGVVPPSDTALQNILEENLGRDFPFEKLFGEKDIRVSINDSKENQIAYLQTFGEITKKNFGNFKEPIDQILDDFMNKKNPAPLTAYLNIASKEINDLLALEAPNAWKEFHLQNLNLWQKKFEVYTAILNQDDDPLKTLLALKRVSDLIQESQDIQSVLEDRIKSLNS